MPFQELMSFPPNRKIGLFHIIESEKDLIDELSPVNEDYTVFDLIHHPQKRLEWLTARLTLRKLCSEYSFIFSGLNKLENGKPFLRESSYEISVTHSFPYVAVIIDPEEGVGIDLEQPKEKLKLIAPRFLNAYELKFADNDITKLCILWCAKEALYKIISQYGVIFKDHFYVDDFDPEPKGVISCHVHYEKINRSFKLYYEDRGDYIFAFNI